MTNNQTFFVGQKAFIQKGEQLLVLIDPKWGVDLPGGKIQEGETDLKQSLQRELAEETGLDIEIGKPVASWTWEVEAYEHPIFLIGYQCKYKSGVLKLSSEHSEFYWVTKNDFRQLLNKHWGTPADICKAVEKYFSTQ